MNLKKFSIQQKEEGKRIVKRAISMAILREPTKCGLCGQTNGIIEYYISDYRPQNIIKSVKPLCWTCHRMLIMKNDFKTQTDKYFKAVLEGEIFPPVYKGSKTAFVAYGIGSIYLERYVVD